MTHEERSDFQWKSDNAQIFREFIGTPTGKRLLAGLALREPDLLDGGDVNKALVRSGEVKHHKFVVSFLLELTGDFETLDENEQQVEPSGYERLDDDSKWDGPKLNPQQ